RNAQAGEVAQSDWRIERRRRGGERLRTLAEHRLGEAFKFRLQPAALLRKVALGNAGIMTGLERPAVVERDLETGLRVRPAGLEIDIGLVAQGGDGPGLLRAL